MWQERFTGRRQGRCRLRHWYECLTALGILECATIHAATEARSSPQGYWLRRAPCPAVLPAATEPDRKSQATDISCSIPALLSSGHAEAESAPILETITDGEVRGLEDLAEETETGESVRLRFDLQDAKL